MNHLSSEEVADLLSSVSALAARKGCSFSDAVRQLTLVAQGQSVADAGLAAPSNTLRDFALRVLRARQRRTEILGAETFRDPAWDMVLDLYVQDEAHAGTMISALCIASGVPQTTALRYIYRLAELGLVEIADHPTDHRGTLVRLADHVRPRIDRLLAMMIGDQPSRVGAGPTVAEQGLGA